jgi:hypothetical protein
MGETHTTSQMSQKAKWVDYEASCDQVAYSLGDKKSRVAVLR